MNFFCKSFILVYLIIMFRLVVSAGLNIDSRLYGISFLWYGEKGIEAMYGHHVDTVVIKDQRP